jgi:serine/threonine-protein kinase
MPLRRSQLVGRFRVLAHLARGGASDVYRALDTELCDEVALKIAHRRSAVGARVCSAHGAAAHEAHTLMSLAHPHVLPVRAARVWRGRWVLATPLGVSDLAQRMTRRMSAERARGLALQLLEALAFAHSRRVAHLDVKPQNAILFAGDRLCLSDFGIARRLTRPCWASGSGTIGYLAPEQALGRPSLRSDVFSAGLVVWELFSRHVPMWPFAWPYTGAARIERDHGAATLAVLRRATTVRDSARFVDAGAFLAALRNALEAALEGALAATHVDALGNTRAARRKRAARVRSAPASRAA